MVLHILNTKTDKYHNLLQTKFTAQNQRIFSGNYNEKHMSWRYVIVI